MIPEALVSAVTEAVFSHLAEKAEPKIHQRPFAGGGGEGNACSQFVPQAVVYLLRQASCVKRQVLVRKSAWWDEGRRCG